MGSASSIPDILTEEDFKKIAGDQYDSSFFDKYAEVIHNDKGEVSERIIRKVVMLKMLIKSPKDSETKNDVSSHGTPPAIDVVVKPDSVKEFDLIESEEDRQLFQDLRKWFIDNIRISSVVADKYAKTLFDSNIFSTKKLQKRILREPGFLIPLGFDEDDCEVIREILCDRDTSKSDGFRAAVAVNESRTQPNPTSASVSGPIDPEIVAAVAYATSKLYPDGHASFDGDNGAPSLGPNGSDRNSRIRRSGGGKSKRSITFANEPNTGSGANSVRPLARSLVESRPPVVGPPPKKLLFSHIHTFVGHSEGVNDLCLINPDGFLATAGAKSVKIWNLFTGMCELSLEGHGSYVNTVLQLTDGRLVSGSNDRSIKFWSLQTRKCVLTISGGRGAGHSKGIWRIEQLQDGRLISASADNTLRIWSFTDGSAVCDMVLKGHSNAVRGVLQIPDGRVASCSWDNSIRIWDLSAFALGRSEKICCRPGEGHSGAVSEMLVLRDGRLVSISDDWMLKIWIPNANTAGFDLQLTLRLSGSCCSLCELMDGRLAVALYDGVKCDIALCNIPSYTQQQQQQPQQGPSTSPSPSAAALEAVGVMAQLEGHSNPITRIKQHANGCLLSASADKTVRVWKGY